MDNNEQTLKNFEDHLIVSDHNMAARTISYSGPQGFLCEICTETSSYFTKILIDPDIEFAIIEAYLGVRVQPAFLLWLHSMSCRLTRKRKLDLCIFPIMAIFIAMWKPHLFRPLLLKEIWRE